MKQHIDSLEGGISQSTQPENDGPHDAAEPASDDFTNPFGDWLREQRSLRGWTQLQLAAEAGVSQPQVSNLEAGRSRNPQTATREKLEKALGAQVPTHVTEDAQREAAVEGLGALIDFDPHDEALLPTVPGVYVFYDISDRPVYVGKASARTIRERVREHYEKFWFRRPIVDHAAYVEVSDSALCSQIEQILIQFLKSNAVLNKQHVDR